MRNVNMVSAVIFARNGGQPFGFEVRGHAGYGPYGKDIICAAVSALAQTSVLGLKKYVLPGSLELEVKPGYLRCIINERAIGTGPQPGSRDSLKASGASGHDSGSPAPSDPSAAEVILGTLCLGLSAIEEHYGKNFRLEERRCASC